jgi:probable rRNA maturation factor
VERDGFSLSLLFTDDEKIQELNRDFRGKDMATDVLSFSQMEGEEFGFENHFLGDIVIAVPYVTKQAQGLGHSVFEEVRYLILHGILHLMGYDHDENEDCEMSRLEKSIYKKLTGETVE